MVYRRDDGDAKGESGKNAHARSAEPPALTPMPSDKSEVSALLRLLTQLANCGLDAGAKPLLHTGSTSG